MNQLHPLISGVLITAITAVISTPLFVSAADSPRAESPIAVESRDASAVTYRPPIEDTANRSGIEDQYQMQLLQQEVMELRGVVEELRHQITRMKSIQDDRYLELDGRLQQLIKTQTERNKASGPAEITELSKGASAIDENLSEKELYEITQASIREGQYDLSITQLETLIERFPGGYYTPNAYYWLGQIYAAKPEPDFEKARQALAQVISYFPDHSKVPDAAFALGKVRHALGDCQRATELLQQVVQQYEGKAAANLADKYLRESVNCDN